jgi:ABC-type uncharacterized transport system permease subunit
LGFASLARGNEKIIKNNSMAVNQILHQPSLTNNNGIITVNTFILSLSAIFFYLIATGSRFSWRSHFFYLNAKQLLLLFGIFAISFHAGLLYQFIITPQGINLGFFNAASLVMWVIAWLLLLSLPRKPLESLVIVLFPLAAIAIGLENLFHSERILLNDKEWGVSIHIIFSILAYSLLAISAWQAIFLAIQDYYLHHKQPSWVMAKLPPLQIMEDILFQMIALGFGLLSLSLITGIVFVDDILAQHLAHKTVLSIMAWGVFAGLLWGHWRYGWRGKTAIRWSLSGFIVLMLAYFGSKLVLELILHR